MRNVKASKYGATPCRSYSYPPSVTSLNTSVGKQFALAGEMLFEGAFVSAVKCRNDLKLQLAALPSRGGPAQVDVPLNDDLDGLR